MIAFSIFPEDEVIAFAWSANIFSKSALVTNSRALRLASFLAALVKSLPWGRDLAGRIYQEYRITACRQSPTK